MGYKLWSVFLNLKIWEGRDGKRITEMHNTICPGSSDPFYILTYYIKWVTTSWTYSLYPGGKNDFRRKSLAPDPLNKGGFSDRVPVYVMDVFLRLAWKGLLAKVCICQFHETGTFLNDEVVSIIHFVRRSICQKVITLSIISFTPYFDPHPYLIFFPLFSPSIFPLLISVPSNSSALI